MLRRRVVTWRACRPVRRAPLASCLSFYGPPVVHVRLRDFQLGVSPWLTVALSPFCWCAPASRHAPVCAPAALSCFFLSLDAPCSTFPCAAVLVAAHAPQLVPCPFPSSPRAVSSRSVRGTRPSLAGWPCYASIRAGWPHCADSWLLGLGLTPACMIPACGVSVYHRGAHPCRSLRLFPLSWPCPPRMWLAQPSHLQRSLSPGTAC